MISSLQVYTPRMGAAPAPGAPKETPQQDPPAAVFQPAPQKDIGLIGSIRKKWFDGKEFGKLLCGLFGGVLGAGVGGVGCAIAGSTLAAPHTIIGGLVGGVVGVVVGGPVGMWLGYHCSK